MIEIRYLKSDSGLDNCFEIWFWPLDEYIPDVDGVLESSCTWSAYEYYTWLFEKYQLFRCSERVPDGIWTFHWKREIDGIPFIMIYNSAEDMMSFRMDTEYISHIAHIAERITGIIEKEADLNPFP